MKPSNNKLAVMFRAATAASLLATASAVTPSVISGVTWAPAIRQPRALTVIFRSSGQPGRSRRRGPRLVRLAGSARRSTVTTATIDDLALNQMVDLFGVTAADSCFDANEVIVEVVPTP